MHAKVVLPALLHALVSQPGAFLKIIGNTPKVYLKIKLTNSKRFQN